MRIETSKYIDRHGYTYEAAVNSVIKPHVGAFAAITYK